MAKFALSCMPFLCAINPSNAILFLFTSIKDTFWEIVLGVPTYTYENKHYSNQIYACMCKKQTTKKEKEKARREESDTIMEKMRGGLRKRKGEKERIMARESTYLPIAPSSATAFS